MNGDGRLDLVLHFRTQDTMLRSLYEQLLADDVNGDGVLDSNHQTAKVSLTGKTVDDVLIEGFDAPCLHTMYLDKPMKGHGLMQAIARVNRVFRDKPGGLVVDYLGLADELKQALATYTESGGKGETTIDTAQAVAAMLEKYEVCCDMLHGFDWSVWSGPDPSKKLSLLPAAQNHLLEADPKEGKQRYCAVVYDLSRAFALCPAHPEAIRIRDDVAFFQAVRAAFLKQVGDRNSPEDLDQAIRQLVSKAITAGEEVIDVFSAAGLKKPDISILSDEFLAKVQGLPHRNLAVELLKKLLQGEIKVRRSRNVVQSRQFSELLQKALNAYQNRAITNARGHRRVDPAGQGAAGRRPARGQARPEC